MKKLQHGFSLLEVMIAVIVLSLSALFLAKLNAIALQGTSSAADRQIATRLAAGVMDEVRQAVRSAKSRSIPSTYTGVPGATPIEFTNCIDLTTPARRQCSASYTGKTSTFTIRRTHPAALNLNDNKTAFNIQVDVAWTGSDGQTQRLVTVTSILPEPAAPWISGTSYVAGDLVSSGEKVFLAKENHTADTTKKPKQTGADSYWEKKT